MTDLLIPCEAKGKTNVGAQLLAFSATAKPGDVVHAPPNATYWSDLTFPVVQGVSYDFDGATIVQHAAYPFGALLAGCTITNDATYGTVLHMPRTVPPSVNWGYVTGNGIKPGTEIVLSPDHRSGILSNTLPDATGLTVQFASKSDRGRAAFSCSGKDWTLANVNVQGVNTSGAYVPVLEAQHCINFDNAQGGEVTGVTGRDFYGDALYFGSSGHPPTTHVSVSKSQFDVIGRSMFTTDNCTDITIATTTFDHAARSGWNIEPNLPTDVIQRVTLDKSILGAHRLTAMTSGGHKFATVTDLAFTHSWTTSMSMWLIGGGPKHQRGPYSIVGNHCFMKSGFGATYPAAALICFANAVGGVVQDNSGIVLQPGRFPPMALVRSTASGPIVVSGNSVTGGAESA